MRRPASPPPRHSQDSRSNTPPPQVTQLRRTSSDASYRRGRFLGKLKSSTTNTTSTGALAPPPSHKRTASSSTLAPPSPTFSKSARDMHRLGTLPIQATLAPAMANQASVSSLSLASTLAPSNAPANTTPSDDSWPRLHVHVLPLFNDEPLRMPIEELNQLVKKHIATVVSRSLSRAIGTLEQDITGLLARGMVTLKVKLSELDDKKLLQRLAEVWEIFWHYILPYVEGVFHPLKTDKLMQSLSRTPKTNRPSSPTSPEEAPATSTQSIDVRILALRSFRDSIILPIFSQLHALLGSPPKENEDRSHLPKLQQMLLALVSSTKYPHSTPAPSPSQGESAVIHLLRAIRSPHAAPSTRSFSVAPRHLSFFSGAAPRDRRGRVARKSAHYHTSKINTNVSADRWAQSSDGNDDETPRNAGFGEEREREKEFLDSLRSPELEEGAERSGGVEGPSGGWGLGRGQEHRGGEDDDEEEALDWEQTQGVVERMVGLRG